MRDRLLRPQLVTIRPLKAQSGDEFGDASVLLSDTRSSGFPVKAQVTWIVRSPYEQSLPGRNPDIKAFAQIRRRDIPRKYSSWVPNTNDLVETVGVGGEVIPLFVQDVQPAFPARMSIGNPSGGFDGWRLILVDREPSMSSATQYEP